MRSTLWYILLFLLIEDHFGWIYTFYWSRTTLSTLLWSWTWQCPTDIRLQELIYTDNQFLRYSVCILYFFFCNDVFKTTHFPNYRFFLLLFFNVYKLNFTIETKMRWIERKNITQTEEMNESPGRESNPGYPLARSGNRDDDGGGDYGHNVSTDRLMTITKARILIQKILLSLPICMVYVLKIKNIKNKN